MSRPRTPPAAVAAVLTAVLLVACRAEEPGVDVEEFEALRDEVAELRADEQELTTELAALQDVLEPDDEGDADDADEPDPFAELEDGLDALAARVDELDATRPQREAVQELAGEAATEEVSDVRRELDTVRSTAEQARGEIDELRTLYEVLRERVDRIDERT